MQSLPAAPGFILNTGFILLSIALVVGFGVLMRSYKACLYAFLWLIFTGIAGASGVLADFSSIPPRPFLLLGPALIAVVFVARSSIGKQLAELSLGVLVGYQAFRIIVELLIHQAVVEGIAPPQMTWSGLNLDILSGLSALALAPFASRLPRRALLTWNWLALGLLLWVVGVAIVSMPTPLQQMTPDNIWIVFFPFIWLPTIAVVAALLGHLVLFRKLRMA
ncbi:MAG: hypothetical protein AB8G77_06425 [Rhodothermales bacterium]